MLKVTYAHLGNFYIPCKILLNELGLEPVVPPFTSQRTIALGTNIAPEFLEHLCLSIFKPDWYKHLQLLAKPYLRNTVGGHGLETVAQWKQASTIFMELFNLLRLPVCRRS
jgi:hypothetical protein